MLSFPRHMWHTSDARFDPIVSGLLHQGTLLMEWSATNVPLDAAADLAGRREAAPARLSSTPDGGSPVGGGGVLAGLPDGGFGKPLYAWQMVQKTALRFSEGRRRECHISPRRTSPRAGPSDQEAGLRNQNAEISMQKGEPGTPLHEGPH